MVLTLKLGRTLVFIEPHPGTPKTATKEDNVTKMHDPVFVGRRLIVSKYRMGHILQEIFDMNKLCLVCSLRTTRANVRPLHSSVGVQSEGVFTSFSDHRIAE